MRLSNSKDEEWKTKDSKYLKELQKMLDVVENVKDEELKHRIIIQYLKCDSIITELANKKIKSE